MDTDDGTEAGCGWGGEGRVPVWGELVTLSSQHLPQFSSTQNKTVKDDFPFFLKARGLRLLLSRVERRHSPPAAVGA